MSNKEYGRPLAQRMEKGLHSAVLLSIHPEYHGYCYKWRENTASDGFCSYGERKEVSE